MDERPSDRGDLRGEWSATAAPIALVGFRAAGKTTVGRAIAAELGRPFVDLDEAIERRHGATVNELFARHGEAGFRDRESELLAEVLARGGLVVACGGGVVLREENRSLLARCARVLFLRVPEAEHRRRLRGSTRPRLTELPPDEEIHRLLGERTPLYESVADLVLEVRAADPPEHTVREALALLRAR